MQKPIEVTVVFAALGDDTRLAILSRLWRGSEKSLSQLAEGLTLTRQGVSRHLNVLEQAGLVRRKRVGRETRYTLEAETVAHARDFLTRASEQWDDAIDRLSDHLED